MVTSGKKIHEVYVALKTLPRYGIRVSNASRIVLKIYSFLEIFWLVCAFFRVYQYKISHGKLGSIDIEVSNFGKCQLTHLLIGY